jgi:predicted ribosomally synthesized peptide with SipW-like signal peptide
MLSTKILLTLATVAAVSAAAIGGTYASFTATPTTISSNAFTTGTLSMSRSGSGAIFSSGNMKIGDTATGSVTIDNTGSLAADYTLDSSVSGDSGLAGQLQLTIYADTDGSGTPVYSGLIGDVSSASLGSFAATSGSHTYYFHITLQSTGSNAGDNALQGKTASASFTWNATQA